MMKTRLFTAAAVGAILAAAPAFADEGWYVRGAVGYGAPGDTEVSGALAGEINGEGNLREALALGYEWADGLRIEGELAHRFNQTGAIDGGPESDSDFQMWSAMANILFDFNPDGSYHPYVGMGVGFTETDAYIVGFPGSIVVPGNLVQVHDDDTVFTWQVMAGVGWELTQRLTLDTEYRYVSVGPADYENGVNVDALAGHEAWVGLRYSFAAPPPPPACDDVDFVVYFEWDRSDLTDQARAVIAQAANQTGSCDVTRVSVAGFTDRSGAAAYNVRLSERRANVVRDELVRLGIAGSSISMEAFGETNNAVATADGVREPLNRRTEVVITLD
jgi:outer membrane protein OmpA-like peptidoglycan-associated protein